MTVDDLFKNYQEEAFRLEALPQYKVAEEWEEFLLYKEKGIIQPLNAHDEYFMNAQQKTKEGKRHIRSRIIPNPMTDYFVFEAKAGYVHYKKLGFESYFVEQNDYLLSFDTLVGDFWLFDKKHIVMMEYGTEGEFISANIVDDQILLQKLLRVREFMIDNGKPLQYVLDTYNIHA